MVAHWETVVFLCYTCNSLCKIVCVINVHNSLQGTKSYTLLQIAIIVIINLNALYHVTKGIIVTKAIREPQYQKHPK